MTGTMRSSVRRMSAFWDGGRAGAEYDRQLVVRRNSASVKRIGRIVNV